MLWFAITRADWELFPSNAETTRLISSFEIQKDDLYLAPDQQADGEQQLREP